MDHEASLKDRLLHIPTRHAEQVHIILQWLAFANEPILEARSQHDRHLLTVSQLAELSTVSLNSLSVDTNRYIDPAELERLLDGLVDVEEVGRNRWINDDQPTTIMRLKDEVRRELLSERFDLGAAKRFAFDEKKAKDTIAATCLIFLTAPDISNDETGQANTAGVYKLTHFAALFWPDFVDTEAHSPIIPDLSCKLFVRDSNIFKRWIDLFAQASDMYMNSKYSQLVPAITHYSDRETGEHAPPIVWAAAYNLKFIVQDLLSQGTPINASGGGRGVSALYMAVHQKHFEMTTLLLDSGGDVASQYQEPIERYEYGWLVSPLYFACHFGHPREWIDLLLKDKSKIGRPGWRLEIGMESAAKFGRLDCLKALVEAGADLNKGTGHEESYGCPLQAACDHGSEEAVRFLLEKGADPNTAGGNIWLGNVERPLHMPAYRGKINIVKLLLEHGADPNIQGGDLGNALVAAIWNAHHSDDGNMPVVELLLQHGARPEEEWDITAKIQDLNFDYNESVNYNNSAKKPLRERFGGTLAGWIESSTYDETDLSPGNEATSQPRT
ncbi:MAG: hypothetical protein Q9199_000647 [Rusavskia elegans]